jgi:molybdopterin converting factor small subunit
MSDTLTQTSVLIPTPLRAYTDRQARIEVDGKTVGEALAALVSRYPALKPHLYDEQGKLRAFVNVFRNDEDIRHLQREETPLRERDELSIVPSIAGGC